MHELCTNRIQDAYPNANIVGQKDVGRTENFKITINDSYIVFDNKTNGDQELTDKNIDDFINKLTIVVSTV